MTVTDQSGNSNDFTVATGTLTKTEDNPSNVFATWKIHLMPNSITFSNGNTNVASGNANYRNEFQQLGNTFSGKFYAELKCASGS